MDFMDWVVVAALMAGCILLGVALSDMLTKRSRKPSPAPSATPPQSCPDHPSAMMLWSSDRLTQYCSNLTCRRHLHLSLLPHSVCPACPVESYVPSSAQSDTTGTATPPGESLIVKAVGTSGLTARETGAGSKSTGPPTKTSSAG